MAMKFAPGDSRPLEKAKIQNEDTKESVECYFNPKELTYDKAITYQQHKNQEQDDSELEFTASNPQTMSFEVLFDCFEAKELADRDVYKKYISKLETFAKVMEDKKRPPMITFTWGSALPVFKGVIEKLNVKYTLFLPDGAPTRATVQINAKAGKKVLNKKEAEAANKKMAQQKGKQTRQGDPPMDRKTAEANNIDNPLAVKPGTTVYSPKGK
jgi:Contractile injection system tube protein